MYLLGEKYHGVGPLHCKKKGKGKGKGKAGWGQGEGGKRGKEEER